MTEVTARRRGWLIPLVRRTDGLGVWLIPFVRRTNGRGVAGRLFRRSGLLPFLLLFTSLASNNPAEAPIPTYRTTVAEVRLTFVASDAHNRAVEGLGKEDFAIIDNEMVIRHFRSLSRAPESKLAITLLVDTSESVAPQFREHVSEMLQRLLNSDSIAGDEVTVVAFGGMQPRVVCSGNCRAMSKRLFDLPPQGATPLFDAIVLAAKIAAQHVDPQARPVFIIFSDGADTISRNSAADALQAVIASDAQIYAVNVRKSDDGSSEARTLQNMAEATGGRYFRMQDGMAKILQHVLDDLHFAYVVTYELPEREEGAHWVRILPTRDLTLQFRSRRVYYETNVP